MPVSRKQLEILTFPYRTEYQSLICDGAVRSGKTSIMTVAFVDWAMREFTNTNFAICGKTVGSAIKNIILPWLAMARTSNMYRVHFTRNDSKLIVRRGGVANIFYIYGGNDERSQDLIQGITLAGVLLDEVALMPRSFVEQALARCLSYKNRRYWFNCNPDNPNHWFYEEWIQQPEKHKALHLQFRMTDNPALDEDTIAEAATTWSGVFYQRFVLGEWVKAEGLIYPMFDRKLHTFGDDDAPQSGEWFISIDYGIQNPFSAGLWCLSGNVAYRMAEYYHDGRKNGQRTDEEHADAVVKLAGKRVIRAYIIDPSASSFIVCLKRRGIRPTNANNEVLPGIATTATALQQGRIKIHTGCKDLIRELGLYSWDAKAKEDKPIKENDHACDDMRYFVRTALRKALPIIDRRMIEDD